MHRQLFMSGAPYRHRLGRSAKGCAGGGSSHRCPGSRVGVLSSPFALLAVEILQASNGVFELGLFAKLLHAFVIAKPVRAAPMGIRGICSRSGGLLGGASGARMAGPGLAQ